MWDFLTSPEVITAIGAGLALILPKEVWQLVPIVNYAFQVLDAATKAKEAEAKAKEMELLKKVAMEAVQGAEQLKKNGQLDNHSAKAYATNFLRSNFGLDEGSAELLVESAVREMNLSR